MEIQETNYYSRAPIMPRMARPLFSFAVMPQTSFNAGYNAANSQSYGYSMPISNQANGGWTRSYFSYPTSGDSIASGQRFLSLRPMYFIGSNYGYEQGANPSFNGGESAMPIPFAPISMYGRFTNETERTNLLANMAAIRQTQMDAYKNILNASQQPTPQQPNVVSRTVQSDKIKNTLAIPQKL